MSDKNDISANAMRKANALFGASAEKDVSLREELAAARAASLAKIGELRALRIARDAEKQAGAPQKRSRGRPKRTGPGAGAHLLGG